MAKRGPKPQPASVLTLRGSWRGGKRGVVANLDHKRPPCPQRFIRRAKTEEGEAVRRVAKSTWRRLAPILHREGLLVASHRETFECLCDSYARFIYACERCNAESMVDVTTNGNAVQSPWVAIRNRMFDQVFKAAACFGLTPADIAGVRGVEKPSEDKGKEKFFRGAG